VCSLPLSGQHMSSDNSLECIANMK